MQPLTSPVGEDCQLDGVTLRVCLCRRWCRPCCSFRHRRCCLLRVLCLLAQLYAHVLVGGDVGGAARLNHDGADVVDEHGRACINKRGGEEAPRNGVLERMPARAWICADAAALTRPLAAASGQRAGAAHLAQRAPASGRTAGRRAWAAARPAQSKPRRWLPAAAGGLQGKRACSAQPNQHEPIIHINQRERKKSPLLLVKAATAAAAQGSQGMHALCCPTTRMPTCVSRHLPCLWQLDVPAAGPHPQVIHQDAAPLQLEPKLTLQGQGRAGQRTVSRMGGQHQGRGRGWEWRTAGWRHRQPTHAAWLSVTVAEHQADALLHRPPGRPARMPPRSRHQRGRGS